jgi:tripartite-type tricarboxylate transporter receptor subunit TctC
MFPDVPTMNEAGVAGYEFSQWYGLLAPGKTSREIVATLHSTLLKAMDDPDVKRRIANEAAAATPCTPDEFAAFIKTELAKNARMIRNAGLKRD